MSLEIIFDFFFQNFNCKILKDKYSQTNPNIFKILWKKYQLLCIKYHLSDINSKTFSNTKSNISR